MSEIRAFRCNRCHAIIENPDDRVKERTRFEGPADLVPEDSATFFRDLCRACAPEVIAAEREQSEPVPKRARRAPRVDLAATA